MDTPGRPHAHHPPDRRLVEPAPISPRFYGFCPDGIVIDMVKPVHRDRRHLDLAVNPLYSGLVPAGGVPRYQLAPGPMAPDAAAALVRDEIMLDSNARLNLATYCTTWMEPQAKALIADSLDRNLVDHDQYAQTAELETRCVNILANLWNDPGTDGVGCSTGGSSEATMLAGLAMKFNWRARRRAQGLSADRPNLVMPSAVHTCWPKFCRYWDVEPRYVPIREPGFTVDPFEVASLCDENTIGAVAILGSSALGIYDPVAEMASALDRLQAERGLDVPLHVDAAVGGFIAPFLEPDLVWDFRLPRVQSINTSGHKFGLVYPGIGWIIWRDKKALPKELIFDCELLGGSVPPSRSTSLDPAPRWWRSTTPSCASGSRATARCNKPAVTWRPTWPNRSRRSPRWRSSPMETICRSWRCGCGPAQPRPCSTSTTG